MKNVTKYLIVGSAFLIGYAVKYYSQKNQPTNQQIIRRIIRQIKYQVYTFCIPFAEAIHENLKMGRPTEDIELYLRNQVAKYYQIKEQLILNKYSISKEQYSIALDKYKQDKVIENNKKDIEKVLEETVRAGNISLKVPEQFVKQYDQKSILSIYREMCEEISLIVCQKLKESKRNDSSFNTKDQNQFKSAMKQLDIYGFKVKFIEQKGFKYQQECPNFMFLNLYEWLKRNDRQFRREFQFIDAAYSKIIEILCGQYQNYDRIKIKIFMEQQIKRLKNAYQPSFNDFKHYPVQRLVFDQRNIMKLAPKLSNQQNPPQTNNNNLQNSIFHEEESKLHRTLRFQQQA